MASTGFKVISGIQVLLNVAALILIIINYSAKDATEKPNPYNDGDLSVPAILLMMALPLVGGKIAKSAYGISKSQDESDTMTLFRHSGSSLALLGASIILGMLFADENLSGDHRNNVIGLAWVYFSCHALDRLMDVLLDHSDSLGMGLLNPLQGGYRVTDYPQADVTNDEGVVTGKAVAPKQRLFRAVAVCIFLALNLFGIIFTRVDNEGHKGVMDGDGLNIAAIIAVSLHLLLAACVVAAAAAASASTESQIEIIAINENPLYRSLVAGFVIVAIGLDFGHLFELKEEATWFMVSVAASLLADGIGRDVA
jgi:hypothetical protein